MGFTYRKSLKAGPFRVTASKSGISYSAGVKGARVTKRANGKVQTTLSAPGTGLRYTTTSGTRKRQAKRPAASTPPSARRPAPGPEAAGRPSPAVAPNAVPAPSGQHAHGQPRRSRTRSHATSRRAVHHASPDSPRAAAALHHQRQPCRSYHPPRRHPYRADAPRQDQRQLLAGISWHELAASTSWSRTSSATATSTSPPSTTRAASHPPATATLAANPRNPHAILFAWHQSRAYWQLRDLLSGGGAVPLPSS